MRLLVLLFVALCAATPAYSTIPDIGILLLAHGGDLRWNAEIESLRVRVNAQVPTESALGMADPTTLQAALDRLSARRVKRVVAIPLFVHTRSEVIDQIRYVLGLSDHPSEVLRLAAEQMKVAMHGAPMHHHMFSLKRVKTTLPIIMTPALDDDAFVSRILLEHARTLSRDPARETVILVAHGPVDNGALADWLKTLGHHAEFVQREGKFHVATFAVLRDDAAPPVRAASVAGFRASVAAGAKSGRTIVIPVLIARGGIEDKIANDLAGLKYAWDGRTLMPHEGFEKWVFSRLSSAVAPATPKSP